MQRRQLQLPGDTEDRLLGEFGRVIIFHLQKEGCLNPSLSHDVGEENHMCVDARRREEEEGRRLHLQVSC